MILRWLPRAIADRDELLDYIAIDSPSAAIEQGDQVEVQIKNLLVHPKIGRPGRKRGTRELVINRTSFIAVYKVDEKDEIIRVLRLLHGAQQWPENKVASATKIVRKRTKKKDAK